MTFDNRFTQKAQEALRGAHACACELGQNYIGTEHILAGLCAVDDAVAGKMLSSKGITYDAVREKIVALMGQGAELSKNSQLLMTPRTKRIIELSFAEARELGHGYIGTEHMLLAILREGESVAVKILTELGIELTAFYAEIISAISGYSAAGAPEGMAARMQTALPSAAVKAVNRPRRRSTSSVGTLPKWQKTASSTLSLGVTKRLPA